MLLLGRLRRTRGGRVGLGMRMALCAERHLDRQQFIKPAGGACVGPYVVVEDADPAFECTQRPSSATHAQQAAW